MIIPSGKSGTIGSSARIANDVIAFVDFSNDYGWAGNTANDLSNRSVKYSTPGGYVSVVSGSTAEPGYIDLDGSTDYLIAGSTLSAFSTVTAITIDAWVKADSPFGTRTIVSNNAAATGVANRGFGMISFNDGAGNWVPRINVNNGVVAGSSTFSYSGLTAGTDWVNLFVVVRDGVPGVSAKQTDAKIFKPSGVSASSFNNNIGNPNHGLTSNSAIVIGRRSTVASQYWDGLIGAVKIYNRALSESEMNLN